VPPETEPRIRLVVGILSWVRRLVMTALVLAFVVAVAVLASPLLLEELERLRAGEWQRPLMMLVFFLPFVAVPGLMLRRLWRRRAPAAGGEATAGTLGTEAAEAGSGPLPRRRRLPSSSLGWLVGAALFLAVGLVFAAFFLVPFGRVIQALTWQEVPCEILSSRVARHSGSDQATFSVEVLYRYEVGGRSFQGRRYRFLGGSSSGYEGKREVVDSLQPGTVTACWVDPDEPEESVLDRGLSWEYLFGLLPLVFVALGAVGLWVATAEWRRRRRKRVPAVEPGASFEEVGAEGRAGLLERLAERDVLPEAPPPGELLLEAEISPLGKLGCLTGLALFWNGIVGVFVWQLWREPDWVVGCFLVPFVLVGLVLLVGIPYQLLALANPRPCLRLDDGRLAPGRATTLHWSFAGAAGRLRSLAIRLEGREQVRYRSGDSSSTRREVVARLPLVEQTQRGLLEQGSVRFEVPADAMHSFSGRRSSLDWVLVVHGAMARWPDVQDEFGVVVLAETGW